ncbi:3'(2'),5'-bisphosphate nucleotidase CysQ [Pseudoruegeria sp. HB172150]|uniref:3'(2'),5'-bisphosphate nucleotidase CysQ n=1 Tax=Pseudoruegeria sp. HB172150 TaxID=2721164 RepID=UPI00155696FB|nr:3'(2'),5'-bisphosphate nucleotidase CysQ [Pseudoruegeria sp. HB172150]
MPEPDLELLIHAARDAGEIALRYWRSDQKVTDKGGDAGPVSEGDIAVDRALRETLLAARPGYAWLSEETEDTPTRLTAETLFIVDPIDGTRAYVQGEPTWALSLSVVQRGAPVAGVVYLPEHDKLYAAAKGKGARLNGESIRTGNSVDPDGARILASRPVFDPAHWPGGMPQITRHFRPSLAYRLCLVAEGRFDAMLTLRPTWDWDIAAGTLIAAEAGAAVTDRHGGALRFNHPVPQNPGALVAPPALHAALLARLQPQR